MTTPKMQITVFSGGRQLNEQFPQKQYSSRVNMEIKCC